MSRLLPILVLSVLIPVHIAVLPMAEEGRKALPKAEVQSAVLNPSFLKIAALEFDGLVSDIYFLKTLVFYGSTIERKERPRVKSDEWKWIYEMLDASTGMDPYFLDPYYVGNAYLVWEAKMVEEANILLDKGARHRTWDHTLPFYAGFNHFFFLDDNAKGAELLMKAARRPDAPSLYATLASRLAYSGAKTQNAIFFLEEMLRTEEDPFLIEEYKKRIETLRAIRLIENAIIIYKDRFGFNPPSIEGLMESKIMISIPIDPFGGKFYIAEDGSVKTTSDMR